MPAPGAKITPCYGAGDASQGFVEEFRVKHLVHVGGFDRRAWRRPASATAPVGAGGPAQSLSFGYCAPPAGEPGGLPCRKTFARPLEYHRVDGYRRNANGVRSCF